MYPTLFNPNTATQLAIVSIQLNIAGLTCPTYPEKFTRDGVVESFLLLTVVIVTQPYLSALYTRRQRRRSTRKSGGPDRGPIESPPISSVPFLSLLCLRSMSP